MQLTRLFIIRGAGVRMASADADAVSGAWTMGIDWIIYLEPV